MALLTAQGISRVAIGLLSRTLVLPNTVVRIPGEEFGGHNGDTITVRVPQPGVARKQLAPSALITYDAVNEVGVDVTLGHLYHAKLVSDEELSLTIEDFARQITISQVDAIATGAEDAIAGAMNALPADASFALAASPDNTDSRLLAAREALSEAKVPLSDRFLAIAPDIATRMLSVDKFVKANESGSDSALRDATLGRIYGFTVVESVGLAAGTAVAYHRSGFAFANRPPVKPRGATESHVSTVNGIGMRQVFQYVPDRLSDASVLSTFAGSSVVDPDRVYKLDTAVA